MLSLFLNVSSGDHLRDSRGRGHSARDQRDGRVDGHHHARAAAQVQEDPGEDAEGRHHYLHGGPAEGHGAGWLQGGHQDHRLQGGRGEGNRFYHW